MGKEYQICELEEKGESEQFTVAAVPVIWIVCQMDGSFLCYWPKKNVERKIRQQQPPEEEGNYYKCRILFDGGKTKLSAARSYSFLSLERYSSEFTFAICARDLINQSFTQQNSGHTKKRRPLKSLPRTRQYWIGQR